MTMAQDTIDTGMTTEEAAIAYLESMADSGLPTVRRTAPTENPARPTQPCARRPAERNPLAPTNWILADIGFLLLLLNIIFNGR